MISARSGSIKIGTWNVNGIRAREAQVLDWIAQRAPDVVCLQEIKAQAAQIPLALGSLADYWCFWHGAGGYSGVSLHFKKTTFPEPIPFAHPAFDHECRIVEARAQGVTYASVYVPNGGKDYPAKLAFLEAMAPYVASVHERGDELVLCGDLNVARADIDVHPSQRSTNAIGQRPDERERFNAILDRGLTDIARTLSPSDERMFTWWPYWKAARQRNLGWRIDYILASASLAAKVTSCSVERDFGTSDHAPVVVELAP